MAYILTQFIFHFGWAIVLVGIFGFALDFWALHNRKAAFWLSTNAEPHLVMAALIVFAVMPIREGWDVYLGNQLIVKTPFDYTSWAMGACAGVWLIYRTRKWVLSRRRSE